MLRCSACLSSILACTAHQNRKLNACHHGTAEPKAITVHSSILLDQKYLTLPIAILRHSIWLHLHRRPQTARMHQEDLKDRMVSRRNCRHTLLVSMKPCPPCLPPLLLINQGVLYQHAFEHLPMDLCPPGPLTSLHTWPGALQHGSNARNEIERQKMSQAVADLIYGRPAT